MKNWKEITEVEEWADIAKGIAFTYLVDVDDNLLVLYKKRDNNISLLKLLVKINKTIVPIPSVKLW